MSNLYAFQGQESDDEIKGDGNSVNYKYRMHDPRLGRFFAIDPLAASYPHNSPYAFSENIVINAVELEGLESAYLYNVTFSGKEKKVKKSHNYENNNNFNQRVYRYFNANGEVVKEMVQKLNSEGKAISTQYQTYGSDGNPSTHSSPLLSKSTIGKKESISEKLPAFMQDGYMEGGYDAGNRGAEMYGKKGFYEKGIPLMAGTLGTIVTGGLGAGAFGGGFASTYIGSSLIGGSISVTGNAGGQYLASDNTGEIDGASVVGSFASGFIPGGNACKFVGILDLGVLEHFKVQTCRFEAFIGDCIDTKAAEQRFASFCKRF
jgi:RHS repeat-associated protein